MNDVEERILHYPDLPEAEREAVDSYVSDHPEWAPLLDDIKALDGLLDQARPHASAADTTENGARQYDDETLVHFLATPRAGTLPSALQKTFEQIEAALEETDEDSAALRERCSNLARRLQALDEEGKPPEAHFEALTGHRLESSSPSHALASAASAEATPSNTTANDADPDARPAPSAQATSDAPGGQSLWSLFRPLTWPRGVRYATAVALAALVLYGALFAVSRFSQSEMEHLAQVEGDRLSIEGYGLNEMRMRGSAAASDSSNLDQRYLRSLRLLRRARTTTLGLFPRYDTEQLRRAERQLEAVAQEAEAGSFVQLEALFFLGKARLAQGDKAGATQALRQVVTGGGRLAPEAQRILTQLYEDAAYDGPPGDA